MQKNKKIINFKNGQFRPRTLHMVIYETVIAVKKLFYMGNKKRWLQKEHIDVEKNTVTPVNYFFLSIDRHFHEAEMF